MSAGLTNIGIEKAATQVKRTTVHQMAVTNLVAQSMVYVCKKDGDRMPLAFTVES